MQQPLQQPPALPTGTLLWGRYLIQGYIGGGGFGHIYQAHDQVLGHRRAIKEAFFRDAQTQRQFHLEAEFILNARHPNLVRGYAVFEQGGRFYLVMDYVDGQTVEEIAIQHIRRAGRPLDEAQVLDWVLPICDAAYALHSQPTPIIHRDVKPANIKVTRQGIPVLIDLGLAKLYSRGTQTIGAALAFTPGYAPPEQYQASGATDQRTDVYGLGATLFYLLTGYQPTEAPARLGPHTLPAPRTLNPAISTLTEAAVLKAMSLDPMGRQQSAHDLFVELRNARAALSTEASQTISVAPASLSAGGHMVPCARCGTANPETARYCMRCGGSLARPQRPVLAEPQIRLIQASGSAVRTPEAVRQPAAVAVAASAPAIPDNSGASNSPASPAPTAEALRPRDALDGTAGAGKVAYPASVAPAQDPTEARTVAATTLGLVCVALSFAALLSGWMLGFAVPAVVLASWSWRHEHADMPAELRIIAPCTLLVATLWPPIWMVIFAMGGWKASALLWLVVVGAWPGVRLARHYLSQLRARR